MSTIDQVEAQWDALVWAHATIQAITTKILKYEHTDASETEVEDLYYGEIVNFFECIITRSYGARKIGSSQRAENIYLVEIRYTKEKDTEGESYRDVIRAIETINTLVETQLGLTWNNTVDYFNRQDSSPTITESKVAGRQCWQAVYRIEGRKFAAI